MSAQLELASQPGTLSLADTARGIPLLDRRGAIRAFAMVDAEDFDRFREDFWHLTGTGYVGSTVRIGSLKGTVLLHREIMGLPQTRRGADCQVDHINGDKLDNRRANLRVGRHRDNGQNTRARGGSSSFRGVSLNSARGAWAACTKLMYRQHHLGYFASELEAAIVAESYRRQHLPFAEPDPALQVALAGRHLTAVDRHGVVHCSCFSDRCAFELRAAA